MKHLNYLKYLLIHKYYVMIACFKEHLFIQGLLHDLSKFRFSEWFPYVERFYGKNKDNKEVINNFMNAFRKHIKRNKHHCNSWYINVPTNSTIIEALCDWNAMERQKIKGQSNKYYWKKF